MKVTNELLRTSNKTNKSREFTQIVKTKWSLMLLLIVMLMPQMMWAITGNGSSTNPYQITSATDWATFRTKVNGSTNKIYAKLMNNITLTGNYTPVGTSSNPFLGELDGNNKTITIDSSLTCYQESSYTDKAFGLFGYIDGAYIHDLKVAGSKADSKMEVARMIAATVVGKALNSSSSTAVVTKIYNVQSSVNINLANYNGYLSYGGIVGDVDGVGLTEIKGCTYSGKIYAYSTITGVYGGVVGQVEMKSKASIAYCLFSGEIETTSTNSQHITVGGILGSVLNPGEYNLMTKKTKYTQYFNGITNCFSCGTITSSAAASAGIIGSASQMTINTSNTYNNYYLSGESASTAINAEENDVVASTNAAITVTVASNNSSYGTVSQSYVNPAWNVANSTGTATLLQVSATPADHYHYVSWSDGCAQTHTKSLTADINITATFAIDQHTVTVNVASGCTDMGTVTGGKEYDYNSTATLTATPNTGYHFVTWNDGNTNATREVTVTDNNEHNSYTATFAAHVFSVESAAPDYFKSAATCTEAAVYYKSCHCGSRGAEGDTFVSTEDKDKALGHSFTIQTATPDYFKSAATCAEAAVYYKSCSRCGAKGAEDDTFASTEDKDKALGHKWSDDTHIYCNTCKHGFLYYTASEKLQEVTNDNDKPGLHTDAFGSVSVIGHEFAGGKGTVIFSDKVTSIGYHAFYKSSLSTITIPGSVTSIGNGAFSNCGNLQSVTIPGSVTSIGIDAFCMTGLQSVTIPGSVTIIGECAFSYCGNLQSVIIQDGVTIIDISAFSYCGNLKSVTLPEGLKEIRNSAFEGCNLNTITLPESLERLGKIIDWNGFNLVLKSIPAVSDGTFDQTDLTLTLTLTDNSYVDGGVFWDSYPPFNSITYTRTGIKNQWGTLRLPFDVTIDNSMPYDFYKISSVSGNEIALSKLTGTIAYGTPVIVRMSEAARKADTGLYELKLTASDAIVFTNSGREYSVSDYFTFTGSVSNQVDDITNENGYILANNAFWKIADVKGTNKVYSTPFYAYLKCNSSNGAKQQITLKVIGDENFTLSDVQAVADILLGKSEATDVSRYDKDGKSGLSIADQTYIINSINNGGAVTVTPGSAPTASDDGIKGE